MTIDIGETDSIVNTPTTQSDITAKRRLAFNTVNSILALLYIGIFFCFLSFLPVSSCLLQCDGTLKEKVCETNCTLYFDISCYKGHRKSSIIITSNQYYKIGETYQLYHNCLDADTIWTLEPSVIDPNNSNNNWIFIVALTVLIISIIVTCCITSQIINRIYPLD